MVISEADPTLVLPRPPGGDRAPGEVVIQMNLKSCLLERSGHTWHGAPFSKFNTEAMKQYPLWELRGAIRSSGLMRHMVTTDQGNTAERLWPAHTLTCTITHTHTWNNSRVI